MTMEKELAFATGDPALRQKPSMDYIGVRSATTFNKLIKSGQLPKGTLFGGRCKVWRRSALDAFLDSIGAKSVQREVAQ